MARPARQRIVTSWEEAPQLAEMARPLIEKYHGFLQGAPLFFTWRSVAGKRKDGEPCTHRIFTVGPAVIANSSDPRWKGKEKLIFIEVPKSNFAQWSDDKKLAVLDMALMRIILTAKGSLKVVDLDFHHLIALWQRHGIFDETMRKIVQTAVDLGHQLDLPLEASATAVDLGGATDSMARPGDLQADGAYPDDDTDQAASLLIANGAAGTQPVEIVDEETAPMLTGQVKDGAPVYSSALRRDAGHLSLAG